MLHAVDGNVFLPSGTFTIYKKNKGLHMKFPVPYCPAANCNCQLHNFLLSIQSQFADRGKSTALHIANAAIKSTTHESTEA